jgi:glutathione S-transferase
MASLEVPQVEAWGEANKDKVNDELQRLDRRLADHAFVAGDQYSIADITALVAVDFMKPARLARPNDFANVMRWYAVVSARPSAVA